MKKMNQNEIKEFLMKGTYTAKLGTINIDGSAYNSYLVYLR